MTYAPKSLLDLAAYWKSEGGVNLGIVGDTDHQAKGVSYHLGKDQLQPGAYSATRPRDKAGLTNAASAIDLGKLNGGFIDLRAFSDWLARRCVKHHPSTVDVVEVIYSPDGKRVLGFKDGVDFLIPNYGDASHLTHTHISFFRDSEHRDKTALFEPYFLPDSSTEDPEVFNAGPQERWLLDGGPGEVTTVGAPRLPDGTSDATKRLGYASTPGDPQNRLELYDRDRLTPVADPASLGKRLHESSVLWTEPGDVQHTVTVLKDGAKVWEGKV